MVTDMDGAELLTIGQVARLAGLSTKALRHCDRCARGRPGRAGARVLA
jgi:hypothetical protein